MESIKLSVELPITANKLYSAWLSSKEHTLFTGAEAKLSNKVNGKYTAWDEYISGKNVELVPGKKIIQTWRTTEFADNAPDSTVELTFEEKNGKTTLHLYHHGLQKGDGKKYTDGWRDFYFEPMKVYFSN
jgi:activator of HSP90 ATPase